MIGGYSSFRLTTDRTYVTATDALLLAAFSDEWTDSSVSWNFSTYNPTTKDMYVDYCTSSVFHYRINEPMDWISPTKGFVWEYYTYDGPSNNVTCRNIKYASTDAYLTLTQLNAISSYESVYNGNPYSCSTEPWNCFSPYNSHKLQTSSGQQFSSFALNGLVARQKIKIKFTDVAVVIPTRSFFVPAFFRFMVSFRDASGSLTTKYLYAEQIVTTSYNQSFTPTTSRWVGSFLLTDTFSFKHDDSTNKYLVETAFPGDLPEYYTITMPVFSIISTPSSAFPVWDKPPYVASQIVLDMLHNEFSTAFSDFLTNMKSRLHNADDVNVSSGDSDVTWIYNNVEHTFNFAEYSGFFSVINTVVHLVAGGYSIKLLTKSWGG